MRIQLSFKLRVTRVFVIIEYNDLIKNNRNDFVWPKSKST